MWHLGIETANYYVVPAIKYKYIPDFPLCIPANRILMKDKLWKQMPWTTSASAWSQLCFVLPLLFRVRAMVLFDLLLLLLGVWASVRPATCGEGLLAEQQKLIYWIWSKTAPGTETKPWVFVVEELLPRRDRTAWQSWAWLKYCRGLCTKCLVVEFVVGREAGGKDVVTWSSSLIPSCFCWKLTVEGGKRHFWLWASGSKPGCHLSQGSVGPSCLWRSWPL